MAEVDGEDKKTALEAAGAPVEVEHLPVGPSEQELAAEREATVAYEPPPMLVAPEAAAKTRAAKS